MNKGEKHYISLGGWLRPAYAYVDLNVDADYVADSLFFRRRIRVKFKEEFSLDGDKYRVIFCTVKKKDQKAFEEALDEIPAKMDLFGHLDYKEYCSKLFEEMNPENTMEKKNR